MNIQKYQFKKALAGIITSPNYLTHRIHKYTAKLIPHIPHYFIERYTQRGELVLDPFCGSGTTLVEAMVLGRNGIGIDINPLAKLISEVKTTPIDEESLNLFVEMVREKIRKIDKSTEVDFPNKDYWFQRCAEYDLGRIRYLMQHLDGKTPIPLLNLLKVCFSSIIRQSSNADPRIAKTYRSKRVLKRIKAGWKPKPLLDFEYNLREYSKNIMDFSEKVNANNSFAKVFQADARETSQVLGNDNFESIDFIITSPPYINAQDYFRSYKLELLWLGFASYEEIKKLNRKAIGTERIFSVDYADIPQFGFKQLDIVLKKVHKVDHKKAHIIFNYFRDMKTVIESCHEVLRSDGHFCLVVGDNTICNFYIPTHRILIAIAEDAGFELEELGKDNIKSRVLPPKRNHHKGIIRDEWILLLQKKS